MRGLIADTIAEFFDRKIVYIFGVATVLAILIVLGLSSAEIKIVGQNGMESEQSGDISGSRLLVATDTLLSILVFFGVMAAAGLIPNMFIKGRADFYLSKPISRGSLLTKKFLSITIVYGGVILVCGTIGAIAFSIILRDFNARLLFPLGFSFISFMIWLSIVVLVGVISRSTSVSIMAAFFVYVLNWILKGREVIAALFESQPVVMIVDTLYYILPKGDEVAEIGSKLALDRTVASWMPLWSSLLFALGMWYLAVLTIKRRDF